MTASHPTAPTAQQLREEIVTWAEGADYDELLEIVEAIRPAPVPEDAAPDTVIGYVGEREVTLAELGDRLASIDEERAAGRLITIDEARRRLNAKRSETLA